MGAELSLLLARQNQFKEAVETAEKVAALEPKNLQVLAGVIDIAHRASHLEMAVRHLRRGLELVAGDPSLRRLLARDLGNLGEYAESLELWGALIEENPQDTQALMGRVQTHVAQGQAARALPDTTALLALAPETGRRHQLRRHCKHIAHPILGDATHGKGPLNRAVAAWLGMSRLWLHAHTLSLPHPWRAERLHIAAPLGEEWQRWGAARAGQ